MLRRSVRGCFLELAGIPDCSPKISKGRPPRPTPVRSSATVQQDSVAGENQRVVFPARDADTADARPAELGAKQIVRVLRARCPESYGPLRADRIGILVPLQVLASEGERDTIRVEQRDKDQLAVAPVVREI